MSKRANAVQRLLAKPSDFEWSELQLLMEALGYELKTTGESGRKFIHPETKATLYMHEPHPAKVLKAYQIREAHQMSQTLEHKGYNGSVLYSAKDKTLHGRIVGIRDTVTYEGVDVHSLEENFKAAVDEYLAFCLEESKVPDTPFKGSFNVRLGSDLHKRAALYAEEHHRKLNAVVHDAVEQYLSHIG